MASKVTAGERVAMDMALAKFDGDLAKIFEALLGRVEANDMSRKWKLKLPDLALTQDDLTLGECVRLELESGMTWEEMVGPLASGQHARRFLVLFFETRLGLSPTDALARADAMTVNEVTDAFGAYVGAAPKD